MSELTDEKQVAVTVLLEVNVAWEIADEVAVVVAIPLAINVKVEMEGAP
jgi:hypothetical protein